MEVFLSAENRRHALSFVEIAHSSNMCVCFSSSALFLFWQKQHLCSVTVRREKVLRQSSICDLNTWIHRCLVSNCCCTCGFSLGRLLLVSYEPVFHSASQHTWHSAMLCLPSSQVWCSRSWWMCPVGLLFSLKANTSTNAAASSSKDSLIDSFPRCCLHW